MYDERIILYPFIVLRPPSECSFIDYKNKLFASLFIKQRLAPKVILNDGKQTPMKGHPVFIAQHATATCCRSCLYKWHRIDMNKELTKNEINYIIDIIMTWIKRHM